MRERGANTSELVFDFNEACDVRFEIDGFEDARYRNDSPHFQFKYIIVNVDIGSEGTVDVHGEVLCERSVVHIRLCSVEGARVQRHNRNDRKTG